MNTLYMQLNITKKNVKNPEKYIYAGGKAENLILNCLSYNPHTQT